MMPFIQELKFRNETLFYYGLICFAFAILCLILTKTTSIQVYNVNAWIKPFKFAFSTFLYAWAMAWYCHYLPSFNIKLFNWAIIILLGFEIIYIAIQAGRGQLSHYNLSSPMYTALFSMMAVAASLVTIYTMYVAILFFTYDMPTLPSHYLWAIRMSMIIFVIFSFEGFVMGSKLTHTIGGPDGTEGLWLVGWSKTFGDPRVAHFIGMHALQVLPLLSFYVLKNTKATVFISILYAALSVYTLMQALNGKPFVSGKIKTEMK